MFGWSKTAPDKFASASDDTTFPGELKADKFASADARVVCRICFFICAVERLEFCQSFFQNRSKVGQVHRIQHEMNTVGECLHRVQRLERRADHTYERIAP